MKINEVIVNEKPITRQFQQEAVFQDLRVHRLSPNEKVARISAEPIPDQLKHKLIQGKLTKQLIRQSNIIKPSDEDVRIARDRLASELKRVNLAYKNLS